MTGLFNSLLLFVMFICQVYIIISFKCRYFVCQGAIYIITKSKMLKESMINMVIISYTTHY